MSDALPLSHIQGGGEPARSASISEEAIARTCSEARFVRGQCQQVVKHHAIRRPRIYAEYP